MRAGTFALALISFGAGLAAGLLWRRAPEPSPSRPAARLPEAPAAPEPLPADASRERVRELEARLRQLERQPPGIRTPAEKRATAKEIFDEFLRLSRGGSDADGVIKAFSRLGELDADTASYFVEKYRTRTPASPYDANMPLVLALASGGPDAEALVLALLKDPATPAEERRQLLGNVAGEGGFYVVNRMSVGPELSGMAERLAVSADPLERRGGAGLLGGVDAGSSRLLLQQMALADPDLDVRAAALRALGYGGDRASLQMLQGYTPAVQGGDAGQIERLRQAYEAARERLRSRIPD